MKNIFVISGGGCRGIIAAKALSEVKVKPDLIIGTSVGAILGAYLALRMQDDILKMFKDAASVIFGEKKLRLPRYDLDATVTYLDRYIFKNKKCVDFQVPLVISSSDLAGATTMYYRSDKEWLRDTSVGVFISPSFAAPFYFKHVLIPEKERVLSDGGVGYNNFPIMPAFIEAAKRKFLGKEECHFYAFGTGIEKNKREEKYAKLSKQGWFGWFGDIRAFLNVRSGGFARKSSLHEQINAGFNIAKNVEGVSFTYFDAYVNKDYQLDDVKGINEMEKLNIEKIEREF